MDTSRPSGGAESLIQQLKVSQSLLTACDTEFKGKCCQLTQVLRDAHIFLHHASSSKQGQCLELIEGIVGTIQLSKPLYFEELDHPGLLGPLYNAAEAMLHIAGSVLFSARWVVLLSSDCLKRYHTHMSGVLKDVCTRLNAVLIQQLTCMDLAADEGSCPAPMAILDDISGFVSALFQLAAVSSQETTHPSPWWPQADLRAFASVNMTWRAIVDHLDTLHRHAVTIPCLEDEFLSKVVGCCLHRLHESLINFENTKNPQLKVPRFYMQHAFKLSGMLQLSCKEHLQLATQVCKASRQMLTRREVDDLGQQTHTKSVALLLIIMNTVCKEEGEAFTMDFMAQCFPPHGAQMEGDEVSTCLFLAHDILTHPHIQSPAVRCACATVVLPWVVKVLAVKLYDQILADEAFMELILQALVTFLLGCSTLAAAGDEDVASLQSWDICQTCLFELVLEPHPMVQSILEDVWSSVLSVADEQLALDHLHSVMELLKAVAAVETLGDTHTAQTCPMATQISCLLAQLLKACTKPVTSAICQEVLAEVLDPKTYSHAVRTAGWVLIMGAVAMCQEMTPQSIASWLKVLQTELNGGSSAHNLPRCSSSTGGQVLMEVNVGWIMKGFVSASCQLMLTYKVDDANKITGVCKSMLTHAAEHALSMMSSWCPVSGQPSPHIPAWALASLSMLDHGGGLLPGGQLDGLVAQLETCRQDPALKLYVIGVLKHFHKVQGPAEALVHSLITRETEWPLAVDCASMAYTLASKGALRRATFANEQFIHQFTQRSHYNSFKTWMKAVVTQQLPIQEGSWGAIEEELSESWREDERKLGSITCWDTDERLKAAEAVLQGMDVGDGGEQVPASCSDTPQGQSILRLKPIVSTLHQCMHEFGEASRAIHDSCCTTGLSTQDSRALKSFIRDMTQSVCLYVQHSEKMTGLLSTSLK